jgi:PAS domain S-box-containing protein
VVLGFNLVGWLYVGLFAVSSAVCFAAVPRAQTFDDPDVRRGLVGLLVTAGGWALFKTVFFVGPDAVRRPAYIAGLAVGFGTVWAWLYFCSAYTGRNYHRNGTLRRLGAAVYLGVIALKLTNPIHHVYFTTTERTAPFAHLAIEHGPLHWTATGLSYVLAAVGLFMLFQFFLNSGYDTRSLGGLTTLIALPVTFDIGAQFTAVVVEVIYAPVGVAAFAVGVLFVAERRFIAVRQAASGDGLSIYLDERGRVRDYSTAAAEVFPALEGATGDPLAAAVPSVADAIESETQVLGRERAGEQRYYFVSAGTATLGETGAQLVQLSDVTETERQRRELVERERELNEQNELYRAVIDASFATVFRVDLEGQFTFVSPSAEEFIGYSSAELEGEPMTVTHPDEATTERAWREIEPVVNGEPNSVEGFPLETKAGRTVYTDIRAVPIYDGSVPEDDRSPADITAVQLMVRDATDRRQREGLISVINRVLRHNIRNKMTVIDGYAELLESKLEGDDAENAARITDAADRLLDLTESAQQIEEARDPDPDLEPVDLSPVLDQTVSELRTQFPEASVTLDAPDSVVAESHGRVETALWEIVENAAKHGGDPPSVEVDVTVTELQVVVPVSDDGPGLPEIEQEVLESGTETPLVHGQGLGLWLAYWIVTSVDGELDTAASSEGTTVAVRLPRPS